MEWLKDQKAEYIICAAIWVKDGKVYPHQPKNVTEGIVVCGRRHHNCFIPISIMFPKIEEYQEDRPTGRTLVQGFLTSKDNFVDRIEGAKIAFESGQVSIEEKVLFSEDLY